MIIGLDLDNTLVGYDASIHALVVSRGMLTPDAPCNKRAIRDLLRAGPDGDDAWRLIQALIYGPLMVRAEPVKGARSFARQALDKGYELCIISHKSEFASKYNTGINFRQAARDWLRTHGWTGPQGRALVHEDRVFFESTRAEKVDRIRALGCELFIDDLSEVLTDPHFPTQTRRILFNPAGCDAGGVLTACRSFEEIGDHVFGR